MHFTEKLQQDLSLTELCDLTYRGKVSVGWFGDFYVSVDGFEGSEYVDTIAQKILDKSRWLEILPGQPTSLKERINGTLCLEKLDDIYNQIEHLPLIHRIFLELIDAFKALVDFEWYYANKQISERVSILSGDPNFMKLPMFLFAQEFPNKDINLVPFRFCQGLGDRMITPLDLDQALRSKGKDWIKSNNIPREAALKKLGPNFFNGD